MTVLVTGAAGFIGFHMARALLERGDQVVGVDCFSEYYDVNLKNIRIEILKKYKGFKFETLDITRHAALKDIIFESGVTKILHLAAQAGVRYSLNNPFAYTKANIDGHLSVLEAGRTLGPRLTHLVYASSSSVYGDRPPTRGFRETDPVDAPVSLYAATKRADELMAATYAHLYHLPLTGLRFFTVYGPMGRPDMAYFHFAEQMLAGKPIQLFNKGRNLRDFTYIGDIINPLMRLLDDAPGAGASLYNIGGSEPVETLALVTALEQALRVTANIELVAAQPGDVSATWADTSAFEARYGAGPTTPLSEGVAEFTRWLITWRRGSLSKRISEFDLR